MIALLASLAPAATATSTSSLLWLPPLVYAQWSVMVRGPSRLSFLALIVPPLGLAALAHARAEPGPRAGTLALVAVLDGLTYLFLARVSRLFVTARHAHEEAGRRAAQARERDRLARMLHTTIGAGLTELSLRQALAAQAPDERRATSIADADRCAEELLDELTLCTGGLEGAEVAADALLARLRLRVERLCRAADLPLTLRLGAAGGRMHGARATRLLAIVEEAVVNAIRHAHARALRVSLSLEPSLTLEIADDGDGFHVGAAASGFGLRSLAAHARELDARLEIVSAPGSGTTLRMHGGEP